MALARHGKLDPLQCARQNECLWDTRTFEAAAEGGNVAIVQWFRTNWCP